MEAVGVMPMPVDFRYREVFLRGRPQHARYDDFGARHPKMACAKRAKIFSPFDALKGFQEALAAKETPCAGEAAAGEDGREKM